MQGMTSQFPPASLQSKEVKFPLLDFRTYTYQPLTEPSHEQWTGAFWTSQRSRTSCWFPCKWFLVVHHGSKYRRRWRCKVGPPSWIWTECWLIDQCDESTHGSNLIVFLLRYVVHHWKWREMAFHSIPRPNHGLDPPLNKWQGLLSMLISVWCFDMQKLIERPLKWIGCNWPSRQKCWWIGICSLQGKSHSFLQLFVCCQIICCVVLYDWIFWNRRLSCLQEAAIEYCWLRQSHYTKRHKQERCVFVLGYFLLLSQSKMAWIILERTTFCLRYSGFKPTSLNFLSCSSTSPFQKKKYK